MDVDQHSSHINDIHQHFVGKIPTDLTYIVVLEIDYPCELAYLVLELRHPQHHILMK